MNRKGERVESRPLKMKMQKHMRRVENQSLKLPQITVAIQANYKEQEKQINVVQVKTKTKNKKIIKQVQYKQNI